MSVQKPVDILVISLISPLLVGVYEDNRLIETHEDSRKTSEALPEVMQRLFKHYRPQNLFFARGPGSFMAIKVTYLYLKTVSIALDVPLLATDGFAFNENSPIKAVGSLYFCKENGMITTQKVDVTQQSIKPFALPKILDKKIFTEETEPLYILPAV